MLFKIAIFILFLGPLVFFHELGHFLFARLFGVRVEVFSIGFGPKLFRKKWGETEYAFSLIPLGGYVKMFGENLLDKDEIPHAERIYSFNHKSKFARFCIVAGGPLANFIFAAVLYFLLGVSGERAPEVRLGVISQYGTLYEKGFRSGDVLVSINGHKILSPIDFPVEQESIVKDVVVRRGVENITFHLNEELTKFLERFMASPPLLRSPMVVDHNGKRWALSLNRNEVDLDMTLDQLAMHTGRDLFLFPILGKSRDDGSFDYDRNKVVPLTPAVNQSLFSWLAQNNFYPVDLIVRSVSMGSAADKAKLQGGDIIVALNNKPTYSFEDLRVLLKKSSEADVKLTIVRKGKLLDFILTPKVVDVGGKKRRLIGVYSSGEFRPVKYVDIPGLSIGRAMLTAVSRLKHAMVKTLSGFKKLITAEVSLKAVGGPLSIGKVAADSFQTSLSYFFQIMALISVNLGIINLFPIPVLDGGHIFFIILETINRGPLSRRKLEIAQQFGLSILLLLMVAALFNDFTRFF